ncbi:hypothetical protein M427DRAFT_30746 [Gonapodya prolifera JEL478]|uniref:Uncharacterized protein n=1 Tax=Gonapodya prolifera (strain JEL478) TaxID=1344416 RepID=A0A139AJD1_GONPJ|nr:hypothetical protein M427DRAFT_30746 [Gonapodya prolifera JEL478]|eukprot:KXS16910.1 hypothetical protein M427DRAFT_30746 [Gonapodya prolifera JEL478]
MRIVTGKTSFAELSRHSTWNSNQLKRSDEDDRDPATVLDQIGNNILRLTTQTAKQEPPLFSSPYEVELACRFVRDAADPDALILMREIFEAAFVEFPKSGFVILSAIQYLLAFPSESTLLVHPNETNAEKADELLLKISKMKVPFDVQFMGFLSEKLIEQSQKSREVQKSELNVSS